MKIGYFASLFPYKESFQGPKLYSSYPIGGSETWAYHLAQEMVKLGHDIVVFTASADSRDCIINDNNVIVHRYGTNFKIQKGFFSIGLFLKSLRHDVDIVHLHYFLPPGNLAALLYILIKKKPLIITYHSDADLSYGTFIRKFCLFFSDRLIVNQVLKRAKLITCNSIYYIPLSAFLPKYKEKIIDIPPGINLDEVVVPYSKAECRKILSLDKKDKIILFVGHLINYKSPNLIIKALPQILQEIPEAKLIIIGHGPMGKDLQILTDTYNLSDKVIFTGMVSDNLKHLYYKTSDVFVLPSTSSGESFGIVLLEAAAAGLPIVVSSLDAFKAFIRDGYNGLVADVGNTKSLAEQIIRILSDKELKKRISKNARVSVQDYSWHDIARRIEALYLQILKNQ